MGFPSETSVHLNTTACTLRSKFLPRGYSLVRAKTCHLDVKLPQISRTLHATLTLISLLRNAPQQDQERLHNWLYEE